MLLLLLLLLCIRSTVVLVLALQWLGFAVGGTEGGVRLVRGIRECSVVVVNVDVNLC